MIRGQRILVASAGDIAAALERLGEEGTASLPVLTGRSRKTLLDAARRSSYRPARRVVGSGASVVRQQMECCGEFADDSPFHTIRRRFQELIDEALETRGNDPFATPLRLDDMMLQHYQLGPIGITPHRDHARYINLACLFTPTRAARFCLCSPRRLTCIRNKLT